MSLFLPYSIICIYSGVLSFLGLKKIWISILISSVFIFLQVILWFLSVSVFEIKKSIKYSFKFVIMDYMCIVNAEIIPQD